RSLVVFKSHFEEVVFMGHSAKRITELLQVWDNNKKNSDEGFWQAKLSEHAFAISQAFSVPVTLIRGRAYVGGMNLDGKDARFLDFLMTGGHAQDAILVEIKTPTARLLGRKYRNVFPASQELTGAIVQVNDYAHTFFRNFDMLPKHQGVELNAFN